MTEIVLFHHVRGRTPGVVALAERLREEGGHTVHTPDLFEGRTFDAIEDGEEYCREVGFETVSERGVAFAQDLPEALVYAGISLGVMPTQYLAQRRGGALGALILESFIDPAEFGGWPAGLPAQVHGMEADPYFAGEGDLEAARGFVAEHPEVELFGYPGDQHLFVDASLPSYDEAATSLVVERALAFLDRVGGR